MAIQKIYKKAVNAGYDAEIVPCICGYNAVRISGENDPNFAKNITSMYKKGIHIDFRVDYNCAYVMPSEDFAQIEKINNEKFILIDIFFTAMRDTKDQKAAKDEQYQYAMKNNCLEAFNLIYA